jgi:hypothetical protein
MWLNLVESHNGSQGLISWARRPASRNYLLSLGWRSDEIAEFLKIHDSLCSCRVRALRNP